MPFSRKILLLPVLLALLLVVAACNPATVAPEPAANAGAAPLELAPELDVDTVASVSDREDVVLIDVREPWEYEEGHIPGVKLIPLGDIPTSLTEIPTDKTVILTCRSGNRSGQAADFLRQQGFTNVHNMAGGILAWEAAGLTVER